MGPTFDLTQVCLMPPWPLKLLRPLFRGAPWLRDCTPMSFCQLAVIAIQRAAYAFMFLEGPKTYGSAPPDAEYEIGDFVKNRFVFKLVFKAWKVRKTTPMASQKH